MESEEKENAPKREFPTIWNTIAICLSFPICCGFLIWIVGSILNILGITDFSNEKISTWSFPVVCILASITILWLIRLTLYHAENATKALNEIRFLREEIKILRREIQEKNKSMPERENTKTD